MKKRLAVGAVLFLVGAAAMGYWLTRPAPAPPGKVIRDLGKVEERLKAAVAGSARLSLRELGKARYGTWESPIWAVTCKPPGTPKRHLLLVGGTHGNEPAGPEMLLQFVEELGRGEAGDPEAVLDIVPVVNPWGWAHNRRGNGDGLDINRDFVAFKTQEGRLIRDFIGSTHYDLGADFHESRYADGFFLFQYSDPDQAFARSIIAAERGQGFPIEQNTWFLILKTHDGLILAPRWTLTCARIARLFSFGNYMGYGYAEHAFTVETPKRLPMKDRVSMHRTSLRMFLEKGLESSAH